MEYDPVKRFWSYVDSSGGAEACWPWKRGHNAYGYGTFGITWKPEPRTSNSMAAHRAAWEFTRGAIPEAMQVLHACDNRTCCNPKHLFLGTNADNVADKMRKGRHFTNSVGVNNCKAKLTEKQVRTIRKIYDPAKHTQEALGKRFGVSQMQISAIVHRKAWKHLN